MVRFYFDCISPFSWLAFHRLEPWAKQLGVTVEPVPVVFGALLDAHKNLGPAEIPTKRRYTFIDAIRQATALGVPIKFPPAHPFNPLKVLRLVTAAESTAEKHRLGLALCHAAWRDGLDVNDDGVLATVLTAQGFDAKAFLEKIQTDAVKQKLFAQTRDAVANGVFGVPSFIWKDELFWGVDRMDLLGLTIQGKLSYDHKLLEAALQRPRAIDRKRTAP